MLEVSSENELSCRLWIETIQEKGRDWEEKQSPLRLSAEREFYFWVFYEGTSRDSSSLDESMPMISLLAKRRFDL